MSRAPRYLHAAIYEMSRLLNTGLDRETLSILVTLCESGVNPEALAVVVKELRKESAGFQVRALLDRAPRTALTFPSRRLVARCLNNVTGEIACSTKANGQ
jgi:mitotic-spindle organizing protein 1